MSIFQGWTILGGDKCEEERAQAWENEIDPALEELRSLLPTFTNPENVARVEKLEVALGNRIGLINTSADTTT